MRGTMVEGWLRRGYVLFWSESPRSVWVPFFHDSWWVCTPMRLVQQCRAGGGVACVQGASLYLCIYTMVRVKWAQGFCKLGLFPA